MPKPHSVPTIDEYLRQRLMPVEGAIPRIPGIEMFGNSIPAGTVGGDLFEYINFQQRYDIDARIERAKLLAVEYIEPLPPGAPIRNSVDEHVLWLRTRSEDMFPSTSVSTVVGIGGAVGSLGGALFTILVSHLLSLHPLVIFTLASGAYVTSLLIFQLLVPRIGVSPGSGSGVELESSAGA